MSDKELTTQPTSVAADDVNLPDKHHQFAVTSTDYSRPYLLGCYATLDAALKAQGGKPEKWDIFARYPFVAQTAHPVADGVEVVAWRNWSDTHDQWSLDFSRADERPDHEALIR